MSSQQALFHEDLRDALRHAVKALGGFEAVGVELWPAKTRKAAGIWLSDCLNPERQAKLDLEELSRILAIARGQGVHCAMHALCDETGYERSAIAPARTPQQELAAKMRQLADQYGQLADEHAAIENAQAMAEIRKLR